MVKVQEILLEHYLGIIEEALKGRLFVTVRPNSAIWICDIPIEYTVNGSVSLVSLRHANVATVLYFGLENIEFKLMKYRYDCTFVFNYQYEDPESLPQLDRDLTFHLRTLKNKFPVLKFPVLKFSSSQETSSEDE